MVVNWKAVGPKMIKQQKLQKDLLLPPACDARE